MVSSHDALATGAHHLQTDASSGLWLTARPNGVIATDLHTTRLQRQPLLIRNGQTGRGSVWVCVYVHIYVRWEAVIGCCYTNASPWSPLTKTRWKQSPQLQPIVQLESPTFTLPLRGDSLKSTGGDSGELSETGTRSSGKSSVSN